MPDAVTTRTRTRLRRASFAGLFHRGDPPLGPAADVEQEPDEEHRDHQRAAAVADERQRDALVRDDAEHDADVEQHLDAEQQRDAEREVAAEHVARAERRADAAPHQQREQDQHGGDADVAHLLADRREDEVVVRLGHVAERLVAVAEPGAGQAARAHREPRLEELVGLAARVRLGVEVREEPLHAPRRADDEVVRDRRGTRAPRAGCTRSRVPAMNSMPSVVAPSTIDEPRSGCSSSSAIIAPHTTRCGTKPTVNVLTWSALRAERVRQVGDERELGDLDRLERQRPERDPPRRAVARRGEQRDAEQHQRRAAAAGRSTARSRR